MKEVQKLEATKLSLTTKINSDQQKLEEMQKDKDVLLLKGDAA